MPNSIGGPTRWGILDSIRYLGLIPDSELPAVYRGAHAVAFVSLYEGFGFPIVEGMGCGTPVLTSAVSSMPEVAGGRGGCWVDDPLSVDEITHALERICNDSVLRARFAKRWLGASRTIRLGSERRRLLGSHRSRHVSRANMNCKPRVLVMLATFNGANWLAAQLRSVLTQSGVDVGILASDDGSTDGTRCLLEDACADDPRVTLRADDVRSGSAAANFLALFREADVAGFTHVALCDQDDVWMADKLSVACAALQTAQADLYSSSTLAFWPDGSTGLLAQSASITDIDFLFEGGRPGLHLRRHGSALHEGSGLRAEPPGIAPRHRLSRLAGVCAGPELGLSMALRPAAENPLSTTFRKRHGRSLWNDRSLETPEV